METINSQEELVETIRQYKKKFFLKWFSSSDEIMFAGKKIAFSGDSESKYGWTNYHKCVEFRGELIDLKIPTLVGATLPVLARSLVEKWFNDNVWVPELPKAALQREHEIYTELYNSGFPTFESRQELIHDKNGEPEVSGVLLTRRVDDPEYVVELILDQDKSIDHIVKSVDLLKRLHTEHDVVWVDAILTNMMVSKTYTSNGQLLLYDFGAKPNYNLPLDFLMGKDLYSMCLSCTDRTKKDPSEIVPIVVETYQPTLEIINALAPVLEKELVNPPRRINKLAREVILYNITYGMEENIIKSVVEELYKSL